MNNDAENRASEEGLPLSRAAEFLLDECRMVLPGIQALFGFQLIAVFNSGFLEILDTGEHLLHLLAIMLVAISIALIMTPAAYHRQTGAQEVTTAFICLSTRLLLYSMWPLCVGICLDFYLVARVLLDQAAAPPLAPLLALALFSVFVLFWFALPRITALRHFLSRAK